MPILYEYGGVTGSVSTVDTVLTALYAQGGRQLFLRELHLWILTAPTTVGRLALKRATTAGSSGLSATTGVPRDPAAPAATAQVLTNWLNTAPTVRADPAGALRRVALPAVVGNGIIWTWYEDDGLIVPAGGEICVCNAGATATGTWWAHFAWEE